MITLEHIYWLSGLMMTGVAIVNFRDRSNRRRINNTAFWGIYGITFLIGSRLPDVVNGFLVIAMVLVASIRGLGQGADLTAAEEREASARRNSNLLPNRFAPTGGLFQIEFRWPMVVIRERSLFLTISEWRVTLCS